MPKGFFESLFDALDSDKDKGKKAKQQDSSFTFKWFNVEPARPFQKSKKHKPAHKDLEAYSSDEEADEDGFFDENDL